MRWRGKKIPDLCVPVTLVPAYNLTCSISLCGQYTNIQIVDLVFAQMNWSKISWSWNVTMCSIYHHVGRMAQQLNNSHIWGNINPNNILCQNFHLFIPPDERGGLIPLPTCIYGRPQGVMSFQVLSPDLLPLSLCLGPHNLSLGEHLRVKPQDPFCLGQFLLPHNSYYLYAVIAGIEIYVRQEWLESIIVISCGDVRTTNIFFKWTCGIATHGAYITHKSMVEQHEIGLGT